MPESESSWRLSGQFWTPIPHTERERNYAVLFERVTALQQRLADRIQRVCDTEDALLAYENAKRVPLEPEVRRSTDLAYDRLWNWLKRAGEVWRRFMERAEFDDGRSIHDPRLP